MWATWVAAMVLTVALPGFAGGADAAGRVQADFSNDPGWDALNNRLVPEPVPVTRQRFGWRDTDHAGGKSKGEIGGRVQRSRTAAYYATPIQPKSLNDRLRASGRLAVRSDDGSSGVLLGWFNKDSRGWRTPNSMAMRVDGNGERGYILFYEYGTQGYLAGGGGAFEGPRYQTTKTPFFRPDGTSHAWTFEYDPGGANGDGLMRFTVDDRTYEEALAPGHKADGAAFDRFGIWNAQTTGGGMDVYFDDLVVDGRPVDLDKNPGWEGLGNEVEFADRVLRPFQDFGFSPTNKAGGNAPGEIGGTFWRDDKPAYYAAPVGPLSLDDALVASGTIAFHGQGSDSGVWLGWFDAAGKRARTRVESKDWPANSLGILIEGPSRIGHYFRPGYRTSKAHGKTAEAGPVIHPNAKPHRWTLRYDPRAAGGNGQVAVTFDDQTVKLAVRPDDRKAGATFDRFGFWNVQEGGHYVEIFVDDLSYTATRER